MTAVEYQETDRTRAVYDVLRFLRHPLSAAASRPEREIVYKLVAFWAITTVDMLDMVTIYARKS